MWSLGHITPTVSFVLAIKYLKNWVSFEYLEMGKFYIKKSLFLDSLEEVGNLATLSLYYCVALAMWLYIGPASLAGYVLFSQLRSSLCPSPSITLSTRPLLVFHFFAVSPEWRPKWKSDLPAKSPLRSVKNSVSPDSFFSVFLWFDSLLRTGPWQFQPPFWILILPGGTYVICVALPLTRFSMLEFRWWPKWLFRQVGKSTGHRVQAHSFWNLGTMWSI
jgi:hypothetical protein